MTRKFYLPKADTERLIWLNNFASKFAQSGPALGFSAADITSVTNDAAMFAYLMGQVETFTTAKEQRVKFKNLFKEGPIGKAGGGLPLMPAVTVAPTMITPGIFPRIAQVVQRIKNYPAYTEAMGKDLGIIGAEQTANDSTMKPVLKLVGKGGQVVVKWKKYKADAVHIEVDRGEGVWTLLAIDTVPHFVDKTPVACPAVWKYRAMYIVADVLVGQWSDVVSINVA